MKINATAGDIEMSMVYVDRKVEVIVKDIPTGKDVRKIISLNEAAATIALFVDGGFTGKDGQSDEEIDKRLYAISEPVWKDVPNNLRPIP